MIICDNDPILFDTNNTVTMFFLNNIKYFGNSYKNIHPYISLFICIFGVIINFIHIIVLTRKNLRKSAVNCIMTVVAICDMLTMLTYLIYNFHFRIAINFEFFNCINPFSYLWILFLYLHATSSIFLHSLTLWLAVAMAFLRRITFKIKTIKSSLQNSIMAYKICFLITIIVFISTIPNIMVHKITKTSVMWNSENNSEHCPTSYNNYTLMTEVIYTLDFAEMAKKDNCKIFKANLWLTGIFNKLIPSFLLFLLLFSLIHKLKEARKKRKKILNQCRKISINEKKNKKFKTTVLLLGILVVFLLTELPQGFLIIFSAIWTNDVFLEIYNYMADFLDLLSLINSLVNFFMYCIMSSRYRVTFINVVFKRNFGNISNLPSRMTNSLFTRDPTICTSETFSKIKKQRSIRKNRHQSIYGLNHTDKKFKKNSQTSGGFIKNKRYVGLSERAFNANRSDTSSYSNSSSLYSHSNWKREYSHEVKSLFPSIYFFEEDNQSSYHDNEENLIVDA
uniref:G_PROTEIN_RECEP_F1_2 domain-containing protein n=1 Tax=Strongyloides papillosus TaxID=174720 RepID=A0A0N5BN65_STREA